MKMLNAIATMMLLLVLLVGCVEDEISVDGGIDVTHQDNFTECEIRQVGSNYLVRQNGADNFSMAIDPSIVYTDGEWLNLTEADSLRVSPLTAEEEAALSE